MGLPDSTLEIIAVFVVFVHANATSMLVAGFICWFLGRMGSVNAAIPRFLPRMLHGGAAAAFLVTGCGFFLLALLGGSYLFGAVAGCCMYLTVRNLWHGLRVPRRVSAEEAFFDGPPPPAPEGTLPEEGVEPYNDRS